MPNEDTEIEKIKEKIKKTIEDRAELADKFMSANDGKAQTADLLKSLEKYYGIKLTANEEDPDNPARPADSK
jgi:hypothetical protein